MSSILRLLREPLIQFMAIGAMIFAAYGVLDDTPTSSAPDEIRITAQDRDRLAKEFQTVWRRAPTPEEMERIIREYVREEVFVREALALGLDGGDAVIRRRLRQKMDFLMSSAVAGLEPTEEELGAFYQDSKERYATKGRQAFEQIYLGDTADDEAIAAIRAELAGGANWKALGQRLLAPAAVQLAQRLEVDGLFGGGFYDQLSGLDPDRWGGPVRSGYGFHLVRVVNREAPRVPEIGEIRDDLITDWRRDQAEALREQAYARMRERYRITIDPPEDQ